MLGTRSSLFRHTTLAGKKRKLFSRAIKRCIHATQVRTKDNSPGPSGTSHFDYGRQAPLHQKIADAWRNTPTKWYPLPIFVGALLLVAINYRHRRTQSPRDGEEKMHVDRDGNEVIRLRGPLQVHVLGALPLRNLSRLWGYLNSFELPVWFRPTGFRVYSTIFGCDLTEIEHSDLTHYKSLGDFFYRRLKDGARPIDSAVLVSPADGRILHFGTVKGLRVEQVKGLTYSLDALFGSSEPSTPSSVVSETIAFANRDHEIVDDEEFANVNGIDYSLDQLFGAHATRPSSPDPSGSFSSSSSSSSSSSASSSGTTTPSSPRSPSPSSLDDMSVEEINKPRKFGEQHDASVPQPDTISQVSHDASVAADIGVRPPLLRSSSGLRTNPKNDLFFTVIYLAPGDYHRFHSPAAWVVEKRRHFMGELFSVSPYMAKRLQNLFVLNERVSLLGRWKHGFFGMVPVGATNVGSILLNFDKDLRTNVRGRRQPPGTFTEAVYTKASSVLRGKPLRPGEEMGGFCLGSTIVLVFEAPKNFAFDVQAGQKIKVGQRLGDVRQPEQES
ncbi:phosphatidylserine decarboxylase [Schizopora paradoxa]|uniref:Phosphatidylserine decarboxylase proenzyme 1, mitochondrial n=1 Tax=Schizopora paradoxa TaxID=27342 RepID=A0A0H2S7F2_9AGAM|nr:phosphatidylserine decarboxylase [Schizopora paradoxa]